MVSSRTRVGDPLENRAPEVSYFHPRKPILLVLNLDLPARYAIVPRATSEERAAGIGGFRVLWANLGERKVNLIAEQYGKLEIAVTC